MDKNKRQSWDDWFMHMAYEVAQRSTCKRRGVGAVAVKDKAIIATGFNGSPSKTEHCLDIGCLREQLNVPSGQRHELCRGVHAEQNIIIQAATTNQNLTGATIYCTTKPCIQCLKMLINCKVAKVFYAEDYPDELTDKMMAESNIEFVLYTKGE